MPQSMTMITVTSAHCVLRAIGLITVLLISSRPQPFPALEYCNPAMILRDRLLRSGYLIYHADLRLFPDT